MFGFSQVMHLFKIMSFEDLCEDLCRKHFLFEKSSLSREKFKFVTHSMKSSGNFFSRYKVHKRQKRPRVLFALSYVSKTDLSYWNFLLV